MSKEPLLKKFCEACSIHRIGCDENLVNNINFVNGEYYKTPSFPASCDLIYEKQNTLILYIEHKWLQYFYEYIEGKKDIKDLSNKITDKISHSYYSYEKTNNKYFENHTFILFYSKQLPLLKDNFSVSQKNIDLFNVIPAQLKSYLRKLMLRICENDNQYYVDNILFRLSFQECSFIETLIA